MAITLPGSRQNSPTQERTPRTVVGVKEVTTVLVTYVDNEGQSQTQLAVVGDNTVHLLNGKQMGISDTQAQGIAADWLKEGVFKKMGKKK